MELESLSLNGLGRFTGEKSGFRTEKYHLEEPWGYIFATPLMLLRVDQRGPVYAQLAPPGGTVLFRRERHQSVPSCFTWIKTGEARAFTNFYHPVVGFTPHEEPQEFFCEYTPARALYHVMQDSMLCETEIFVPEDEAAVVISHTATNRGAIPREVELLPVMRPHLAAASLAPWDVPALYQRVGYSNERGHVFCLDLRSPAGVPELREHAFMLADIPAPDAVYVDYDSFVGGGTFENPEALYAGRSPVDPTKHYRFGDYSPANSANGKQGIAAFRKKLRLEPGESFSFTLVTGSVQTGGRCPSLEELIRFERYLDGSARSRAVNESSNRIEDLISRREIATPDRALDRYVNEWLPLQLNWVRILDRGWPTGMRGVRDTAQDMTALIPLDPTTSRKTILDLFSIQRSDGWFPRQYSIRGRHGQHDLRQYVDGGVWVWELLYDYLCFTRDFDLLRARVPYLDSDEDEPVLGHALSLLEYYLKEEDLGEHGLCLIRQGDWNDSLNRAGLEGRGESVTVSCQLVLALKQAAHLLDFLGGSHAPRDLESRARLFRERADDLRENILAHALNDEGYLNGIFTDNGEWVFSPRDPDGRSRVNVPVNSFGIISGVLSGDSLRRVVQMLKGLKQRDGWPLFYPPIGDPPIAKLGRIGEGDLAPGLGENGAVYNHGSHGFLGRAAAAAGDGDLLIEILRCMLPYDQTSHPVERSKTAPYAMVNHWKTAPGLEGRGGDCFLTGSVSTAIRNVYNGLFGVKPSLDGLALDPSLPQDWAKASARFSYLGAHVELVYTRSGAVGSPSVTFNGTEITSRRKDLVLDRECVVVPASLFTPGSRGLIEYLIPS